MMKQDNFEKPNRKFVKKFDKPDSDSFRSERKNRNNSTDSNDNKRPRIIRKKTSDSDDSRRPRTFSSDNDEKKPFRSDRKVFFNKEEKPERRRNSSDDSEKRPLRTGKKILFDKEEKPARKSYSSDNDEKRPFKSSKPRFTKDRDSKFGKDRDDRKPRFTKDSDSKANNDRNDRKPRFSKDGDNKFSKEKEARKSRFSKPDKNKSYSEYKEEGRKKKSAKSVDGDNEIRLNRYIANAGICSRREADDLISAGLVTVNGKIITELGSKVKRTDDIKFNGGKIFSEKKVYILLNKPKDYITTVEDPHAQHTVLELLKGACKERVYPVGRLDRMTTGVLLLTNDGDLTKKLTHPKHNKKKIYHATLDKNLTQAHLKQLADGVQVEEGVVGFDAISYTSKDNKTEIGVELHFGMNRIVRRMFESLGYKVKKLDRVFFAGLSKKGLERGHWRYLTPKEINMLLMGAYE